MIEELKDELQTIVNRLFDYKNDHQLIEAEYNDLNEIVYHLQKALNIVEEMKNDSI